MHFRSLAMVVYDNLMMLHGTSRAWEPYIGALVQVLSCGGRWSGVTPDDRLLTPLVAREWHGALSRPRLAKLRARPASGL